MRKNTPLFALILCLIIIFLTTNIYAQNKEARPLRLGFGLNVGLPTTSGFTFALGGDLKLQKYVSGNTSATLTAGYTKFMVNSNYIGSAFTIIPIKVGLKSFTAKNVYLAGEAGAGLPMQTKTQKTAFLYALGLGYALDNGLDLGIKYEEVNFKNFNVGQIALRIAYGFKL